MRELYAISQTGARWPTTPQRISGSAAPGDTVDLCRSAASHGAEFVEQRPLWQVPFKGWWAPVAPEEAALKLPDGLKVRPPDADVPLPVQSPQDLQELDGLYRPGAAPPQPDLGTALQDLASRGWKFMAQLDGEDAQVGRYGAYNAVTEPLPGLSDLRVQGPGGDRPVPVSDGKALVRLATFAREPGLMGKLEREGFRFFTASGQPSSAAALWSSGEVAWIGREEPWIALDELGPDASRMPAFARCLEVAGSADRARRAWAALEGLPTGESKAAKKILDAAQDLPEVMTLGLERLQDSSPGARLTLALADASPEQGQEILAQGLRHLKLQDLKDLRRFCSAMPPAPGIAPVLLRELAGHPEATAAAEQGLALLSAMSEPASGSAVLAAVLDRLEASKPKELTELTLDVVARLREEAPAEAEAAARSLLDGESGVAARVSRSLSSPEARLAVLEAALTGQGNDQLLRVLQRVEDDGEAVAAGSAVLEQLARGNPAAELGLRAVKAQDSPSDQWIALSTTLRLCQSK
ncbi:MAG: hypothetical protein AB1758_35160, partial [Candidatus Eremiobacterota bacterium]